MGNYTAHILDIANEIDKVTWGAYRQVVIYTPSLINQLNDKFLENHNYMSSKMEGEKDFINRFKIVSCYAKAILMNPLFSTNEDAVKALEESGYPIPISARLPNEYFIFVTVRSLLHDFSGEVKRNVWSIEHYDFFYPSIIYNARRENDKYFLDPSTFVEIFAKFLYYYCHEKSPEDFPLFAFSEILHFLEIANDCANFGLAKKYYPEEQ